MLDDRAPGRGREVIDWARHAGWLRVVPGVGDDGVSMLKPVRPAERIAALATRRLDVFKESNADWAYRPIARPE